MALEFMTGATVFALINLTATLIAIYLLYRVIKKIVKANEDGLEFISWNIKGEMIITALLFLFVVFFGSVTQPKLSIDLPQNRELIEYQESNEEVVIETPPPRTEDLQGFESLK